MINKWLNQFVKKINQILRVFYTKRLVKLYKEKVFVQNEIAYREHNFAINKEKLIEKINTQNIGQDEEQKLLQEFKDNQDKVTVKINQSIERKTQKIDERIQKYKIRHEELSKKMFSQFEEELNSINHLNEIEENKIETLEQDKVILLKQEVQNDKTEMRLKAIQELIEEKHKNIEHNNKLVSIQETRKRVEQDQKVHLSLAHLTMKFGGLKAVDDLSFDVKKGEIFGLIGPNGAGKTTVFNCITQFYKPNEGDIFFNNQNNETNSLIDFKVHDIINLGIVRTFQNVELVWELTVLDNLLVGAHSLYHANFFSQLLHLPKLNYEEKVIKNRAIEILTDLGLLAYKDMYPYGLPYGILKKIELARTLMTKPNLIILDEPAAGLNDAETEELAQTIRNIRDKYQLTIFLVEHDMGLVMDICDTVCAISFGKLLAIGTPKEIQNHPKVQEAYLGGE